MNFFTFFEVMTMGLLCYASVANSNSLGAVKELPNPQSIRIVGGSEAKPHQFPWQVGIFMDGAYFCGGSIISDEYILTAAHCADGFSSFEVVIGAHQVRDHSEETDIASSFAHPEWDTFNIAEGLSITNKIEFNEYVSPICIPNNCEDGVTMLNVPQSDSSAKNYASLASLASLAQLPSGSGLLTTLKPGKINKSTPKRATTKAPAACSCPTTPKPSKTKSTANNKPIGPAKAAAVCKCPATKKPSAVVNNGLKTKKPAGLRAFNSYANQIAVASEWGTKTSQDGQISPIFMATNVTILDNQICAQLYPGQFNGDLQLCASSPDKDICQDNSNGQIYVNDFVLVGITTLKSNCTEPKNTRVYTRISPYVNSIQSIVANSSAPATSG